MAGKRTEEVLLEGNYLKRCWSLYINHCWIYCSDADLSTAKKVKSDSVTTVFSEPKTDMIQATSFASTLVENDMTSDSELSVLDPYELVWFNSDAENPIKLNRLRKISDYSKYFDDVDRCRDYIGRNMSAFNASTIFLVITGQTAENLLHGIQDLRQISSIHWLTATTSELEMIINNVKVGPGHR